MQHVISHSKRASEVTQVTRRGNTSPCFRKKKGGLKSKKIQKFPLPRSCALTFQIKLLQHCLDTHVASHFVAQEHWFENLSRKSNCNRNKGTTVDSDCSPLSATSREITAPVDQNTKTQKSDCHDRSLDCSPEFV